jgi:hypothetical protein
MADKYRRSVLLFYLVIKFRERKPGDSTTVVRTSSSTPVQVLPGSSVFTGINKNLIYFLPGYLVLSKFI